MNRILLSLAYLSGILVIAASSGEQDASASDSVAAADAVADAGRECPSCDCTVAEFENLQKNLDSCLSSNKESDQIIQQHKGEIASLSTTIETMSKEQLQWDQEKKELHILINDLQGTIDAKGESEAKLKKVQEDFEKEIKLLQGEIQSMKESHQQSLLTRENEVAQVKKVATKCQSDLLEMSAKHDETVEKLDSVEKNQSKVSNKHSIRVKELRNQISAINKELDLKTKSFRSMQDRYHDAREDVTKLDRELRMMHIRAQNTYFNSTLVMEDTMRFLYRTVDKSVYVAEDLINHPRTQAAYSTAKSKLTPILEPIIPMYKKNVLPKVVEIGSKMKEVDAIEGVRLLLISMIEQGSTTGLNYIELTMDKRVGPRRFQSKASRVLRYTKNNSEFIVHTAFQLFVVYLGYKFLLFVFKILIFFVLKLCRIKKTDASKKSI